MRKARQTTLWNWNRSLLSDAHDLLRGGATFYILRAASLKQVVSILPSYPFLLEQDAGAMIQYHNPDTLCPSNLPILFGVNIYHKGCLPISSAVSSLSWVLTRSFGKNRNFQIYFFISSLTGVIQSMVPRMMNCDVRKIRIVVSYWTIGGVDAQTRDFNYLKKTDDYHYIRNAFREYDVAIINM